MILKIIEEDFKEYNYKINSDLFSFNFLLTKNNNYVLTISNLKEIDINVKIDLLNLFRSIKSIHKNIYNIILEINSIPLFDSNSYNLNYNNLDYNSEFESNIDRMKLSISFVKK